MPLAIGVQTGNGQNFDLIDVDIVLPDSGTSITIAGQVQKAGSAAVVVTGSPLIAPSVPGSGTTYWNIQVDYTTGAATVQQSSSADPAALTNNLVVFRQTLPSTDSANLSTDGSTTPDDE